MAQRTYKLHGIDCANCALAIETALDRLSGVRECAVNDRESTVAVEYDEGAVTSEQVLGAITDAGFDAEPIETGSR